MAKTPARKNDSSANLGFEAKLWLAADKLRNNMDAAEYKHVVLGLIFLKYISDTFDEHHARLVAGSVAKSGDYEGANPEDEDEYLAANVFWVPVDARWAQIQSRAKLPSIGKDVDDAMVALERDNPRLKGALNKSKSATSAESAAHGFVLTPGRYVGAEEIEDDGEPFTEKMPRLVAELHAQFAESAKLESAIKANMEKLGYGL